MGREQKRRQQKKYVHKNNEEEVKMFTLSGFIRTVCGIVIILFLSYFILAVFVTKEVDFKKKDNSSSSNETSSVSNQILASNIFKQKEETYYVYFYDFNDEDSKISSSINNVSETVYRVNTASGFNSNYVTEDASNVNAKGLEDLKVKNPTLIKVTNDTIVSYYEGVDSIVKALG